MWSQGQAHVFIYVGTVNLFPPKDDEYFYDSQDLETCQGGKS